MADRAAFAEEPAAAVAALIVEYHDGSAERGRDHRVVVALGLGQIALGREALVSLEVEKTEDLAS